MLFRSVSQSRYDPTNKVTYYSFQYYSTDTSANNGNSLIGLFDITGNEFTPGGTSGSQNRVCGVLRYNNRFELWTGNSNSINLNTSISINTWYKIDVQIDGTNNTCKGRVNEGNWSTTVSPSASGTGSISSNAKGIYMSLYSGDDNGYIDNISVTDTNYSTSTSQNYVTWINPTNHATTTSGNNTLQFSYQIDPLKFMNQYTLVLNDISSSPPTTIYTATGTIGTSGTITRNITLESDHLYMAGVSFQSVGTTFPDINTPYITFTTGANFTEGFYSNVATEGLIPITQGYGACEPASNVLDVGGGLTYALCTMFIPNPAVVAQYQFLSIANKFPFAYLTDIKNDLESITSTSGNVASSTINLNSLSIGTGTSIGNILPTIDFGKGSMTHYLSSTMYDALITLQGIAMYLSLAFYMYNKSKNLIST